MPQIKYYDNKEERGVIYDWNFIFKEYRKLKVPKDLYNPTTAPVEVAAYIQLLSIRSSGKTTAWILIGMIMHKYYGTQIQYIRSTEYETTPKYASKLTEVIRTYENGKYIRQLTDDKYNSIYYYSGAFYYCYIDAEGKRIEQDPEAFMVMLSVDKHEDYKSGYNAPKGDLVIFDEFINTYYRPDEFVNFQDLLCTIIRGRYGVIIVMLANNTNVYSPYFKEFAISREVRELKVGDTKLIKTQLGTIVYIEFIGTKISTQRQMVNLKYFGFDNPKLNAIRGGDAAWAFEQSPHIWHEENEVVIYKGLRIETYERLLQCEFVMSPERGLICNIHECNPSRYDDMIILTLGEIRDKRHLYGYGRGTVCRQLWDLYKTNRCYYDNNETAAILRQYVRDARSTQKL